MATTGFFRILLGLKTQDPTPKTSHLRGIRQKPKFHWWLPGYFFIFVKVIENDQGSYYDSFLILLAKRFNSAYYLLLDTGKASGGEASKVWLTLSRVVEKRQIHGLLKFTPRLRLRRKTEELFPFGPWLGFFSSAVQRNHKVLPAS
ncbi:MAG: hypothetical protein ACLQBK_11115 [Candidatus Sulfotelmatobacter sp.]